MKKLIFNLASITEDESVNFLVKTLISLLISITKYPEILIKRERVLTNKFLRG